MTEHVIDEIIHTAPVFNWTTKYGVMVACSLCGVKGYPHAPWQKIHEAHALCSCGKTLTLKGHPYHAVMMRRHGK